MPTVMEKEQETPEVTPGDDSVSGKEDQSEPKSSVFDPKSVTPETKAYFEKQYEGHDRYKGMAVEYEQLLKTKEFQDWYRGLSQPKPKQEDKFELTDEQFASALSDKNQFMNLVNFLAEKKAAEKFGPQLQQASMQAGLANKTNELNQVLAKYPDFAELDKRGFIEPYLRKYGDAVPFEDIYWMAKRHVYNEEIDKKARGLVDSKKAASVEKPGSSNGARSKKIKVKTTLEAMELAAEAFKAGKAPPEFDFEQVK